MNDMEQVIVALPSSESNLVKLPQPSHIVNDQALGKWSGIPYAELSVILAHARFLAMVHQTHHWIAKGDPFYGDHLLFQRLYDAVNAEIDLIAEKAVGMGSEVNVSLRRQLSQMTNLSESYGVSAQMPTASDLVQRSLSAELKFLQCVSECTLSLESAKKLTRGLDNMLAGIEDTHESHVYLLKRRVKRGSQDHSSL